MTTTETVMVATIVEVNPIFDELVRDMGLDPFDNEQLVEVQVNGESVILDVMDRSPLPPWSWPDDESINGQMALLAHRLAPTWDTTSTGVLRLISAQVEQPALAPAVDPWETPGRPTALELLASMRALGDRPENLTDTLTPTGVLLSEPTLLGLDEEDGDDDAGH